MNPDAIEVRRFVKQSVDKVYGYAKQEYGFDNNAPIVLKISVHNKLRFRSCAGRKQYGTKNQREAFAELDAAYALNGKWNQGFTEYPHIKNDDEIGSRVCDTWQEYLMVLICHEVAHAIEFSAVMYGGTLPRVTSTEYGFLNGNPDDHGPVWQTIYRKLRNKFVNYTDECLAPSDEEVSLPTVPIGKVRIKHGFSGLRFVQGEFDMVHDFEPTEEAKKNNELYGLPLNIGKVGIKIDGETLAVEVKERDYELI